MFFFSDISAKMYSSRTLYLVSVLFLLVCFTGLSMGEERLSKLEERVSMPDLRESWGEWLDNSALGGWFD